LRELRRALHEQHDGVLGNGFLDPGLDFAHDYTFKKFAMPSLYEKAGARVGRVPLHREMSFRQHGSLWSAVTNMEMIYRIARPAAR